MTKRRLIANITLILLILLITTVVYGLPMLLKTQLPYLIQQKTARNVTLAEVELDLLPLSLTLKNLTLSEKTNNPFIRFNQLTVEINIIQSIKQTALVIENINLKQPDIYINQKNNGDYNFSDLLSPSSIDSTIIPFNINQLSIENGKLHYQTPAVKDALNNIKLFAKNINLQPNQKIDLNLTFTIESGGQFNGQTQTSLNPLYSTGHIEINAIKIQALLALFNKQNTFNLTATHQLSSDYKFNYQQKQFDLLIYNNKLQLQQLNYNDKTPLIIKNKSIIYQGNIHIKNDKNNHWLLNSENTNINLTDFDLLANETNIKLDNLLLKTTIEIDFSENNGIFSFKQSNIDISNFQLNVAKQLTIDSKTLSQNSDYQLSFDKEIAKLIINNNTITAKNAHLDFKKYQIKLPELMVNSKMAVLFSNNTQFNTEQGKLRCHHCELLNKPDLSSLIKITELSSQGINFDLDKTKLEIKNLFANTGNIRSWLNEKAESNYQTLFNDEPPNTTVKTENPWLIAIEQIELKNFAASFVDNSLSDSVAIALNPINLKLNHYSNKTNTTSLLELNAIANQAGNIKLKGHIALEPFNTQLNLNIAALDLTPFHAYIEKFLNIEFVEGVLDTESKLNTNLEFVDFTGNLAVKEVITRDKKNHRNFVTWKNLSIKEIAANTKKNRYTAKAILLDHPYSKITIRKDKSTNFSNLLVLNKAKKDSKETLQPYFQLDSLKIIDASSDFTDKSILLPFYAQIKELNGGADYISSDKNTATKVSLKGNAFDFSPVDIQGFINPYTNNYDLSVNFIGLPMPLISPYMVEFAGYKVEKGKMTLKLKYKIANKQLDASNNILIDQFELGEKVENPKAASLPLELAVALLKDGDGQITIDVPVTGSLDDPEFSLSAIFADALSNVITKVISSPFHVLSDLLNTEEEELSTISFKAGKADLEKTEQQKLIAIANLLKQRPALVLDIKGTAYQKEDWQGLKDAALDDELKSLKANEINAIEPKQKIRAEYVELSTADYRRLLAEQFIKKFPNLAKKSLLGKPELIGIEGEFYQVAKEKLSATIKMQPTRLKRLATQRSQKIASFLIQQCHLPNGQVFILDSALDPERETKDIVSFLIVKGH